MLPKLGILAGGGVLPIRLMQACIEAGRPYFVIAIENQTDPDSLDDHPHTWVRLGAVGKAIDVLKNENVEELVMIGPVRRPSLIALRPDAWLAKRIVKTGFMSLGDDGLLSNLIAELEAEGFRVIGPEVVLTELVASEGVYGSITPDEIAVADIDRGFNVARGLGSFDVGQAVVVQQGLVLAVEAIEGTDAMLSRAGELHREGPGGILVKVKKPDQEQRVDLPTIGVNTVEKAAAAGLRGIAIQAGHAFIVDREEVVRLSDQKGLFITGITINE